MQRGGWPMREYEAAQDRRYEADLTAGADGPKTDDHFEALRAASGGGALTDAMTGMQLTLEEVNGKV